MKYDPLELLLLSSQIKHFHIKYKVLDFKNTLTHWAGHRKEQRLNRHSRGPLKFVFSHIHFLKVQICTIEVIHTRVYETPTVC